MTQHLHNLAKKMAGLGTDSKFFTTTKKGETHELRQELNHQSREKKKSAVKKVIANMTVGKDVSMLFADVVNCMQTADTQLKKLVYLYLINYAKSNPDLTILAVNTFVKDANDPNPLIRALSIRTMGCIRVDRITEYLCVPLKKCLKDDDPYVRKTSAICVAKLYDINPEMVDEQGFIDMLQDLVSDPNPTVVANAVAALSEIVESGNVDAFKITKSNLQKLLAALNECTEWGQVFVLDAIARYNPSDSNEAEGIIEQVTPRLQHANSAVVLSAIKIILKFLEKVTDKDTAKALARKMAPPLVTLLSTEPEIQYVALRNINLIVQKRPNILSHEIKVFFCKYNDPIYVKMEKLEIIIRLVSAKNVDQVLLELKEYATEVDVDIVRRSVRAIGQCAIKLKGAGQRCIDVLLELIETKVNYIVQEAIIVIKDIFRKYPNQFESIIATLCENLDTLDEPEAKASMIWIIGEYAERIDNADEILERFLESFHDENAMVQLQLLTATVKLFLQRPNDGQEMVQRVLNMATEESDNPDLRDRGYVYWRLLSASPDAAKAVVLSEKPTIQDEHFSIEPTLLNSLIGNIATLSSVYHKLPASFIAPSSLAGLQLQDQDEDEEKATAPGNDVLSSGPTSPASGGVVDLLDFGVSDSPPQNTQPASNGNLLDDIFGGGDMGGFGGGNMGGNFSAPPAPIVTSSYPVLLTAEKGDGIELRGVMTQISGSYGLDLDVYNVSQSAPLTGLAFQLNKNTLSFSPVTPAIFFSPSISIGSHQQARIELTTMDKMKNSDVPSLSIQAAIKNSTTGAVLYFSFPVSLGAMLTQGVAMDPSVFIAEWKRIPDTLEIVFAVQYLAGGIDGITTIVASHHLLLVAKRQAQDGQDMAYYSGKSGDGGVPVMVEITSTSSGGGQVCIKTDHGAYGPLFQQGLLTLLS